MYYKLKKVDTATLKSNCLVEFFAAEVSYEPNLCCIQHVFY